MSENPEPRTSKNPERPKVGPQRPNPERPKNETPNVQKQLGDECKFRGFLCALWAQGWEVYIYKNMLLYWIYAANNLGSMWQLNIYVDIVYTMPTIGGWMQVRGFLCALRAQGWEVYIYNNK